MNKASMIRYGATTAIGLAMSAALLNAVTKNNRASTHDYNVQITETIAVDSAQAIQAVDLNMATVAQALSAAASDCE